VILRLATFNVALARRAPAALAAELDAGSRQAEAVAQIVRTIRPDILVLNEFDYDPLALELFHSRYLAAGPCGLNLPYRYTAPVNTGIPSGYDLDGDARTNSPGDALGFGTFPGQYGMALLARYPIDSASARTFQRFPWSSLPGADMPSDSQGGPWYPSAIADQLPLSSKSHWDLPVRVGSQSLHCLIAHPTPPTFDGAERRNYLRNRDEIRCWQLYLDDHPELIDDRGGTGGIRDEALVAVMGDLNADPLAGSGCRDAIEGLRNHRRLQDPVPRSPGAPHWQRDAPGPAHPDAGSLTSWLGGFGLRLDYVLPDRRLPVHDCGVFWPHPDNPRADWIGTPSQYAASDHRLVWVDIAI
jgi:endonuclease/exonuclease/phosphatase family metal-dependent hydrolase